MPRSAPAVPGPGFRDILDVNQGVRWDRDESNMLNILRTIRKCNVFVFRIPLDSADMYVYKLGSGHCGYGIAHRDIHGWCMAATGVDGVAYAIILDCYSF